MKQTTILDQPNEVERTTRKTPRKRRPLPPQDTRDWMTPGETAFALGCSVATVHRLRRGVIPGVEPLPCSQYGRKLSFEGRQLPRGRKATRKEAYGNATVARGSGIRGRGAGKARAHDHQKSKKISTRQSMQIGKRRDLVREVLSR